MKTGTEILPLLEIDFRDLNRLSRPSSLSPAGLKRLEMVSTLVMEALGPEGPGLLQISGVPSASELRRSILTYGRELALLGDEDLRKILKEHGLGSDVSLKNPQRAVSSFARQLKYVQNSNRDLADPDSKGANNNIAKEVRKEADGFQDFHINGFKHLGNAFEELGYCMMDVGVCLARLCDSIVGGHELERSILESGTAKGRLIHYHSAVENNVMKKCASTSVPVEDKRVKTRMNKEGSRQAFFSHLWQQWHYDYGIFTVLTTPMFFFPTKDKDDFCITTLLEQPLPDEHSCLQIFDPVKKKIFMVHAQPGNLIIQVGEAASILSQGRFHATLHSVCRPREQVNMSREMFVVFLHPPWNKILSFYSSLSNRQVIETHIEETELASDDHLLTLNQEITKVVPPLSSRLRDGMTFAEFARETTKQYYGGNGLQSRS